MYLEWLRERNTVKKEERKERKSLRGLGGHRIKLATSSQGLVSGKTCFF